MLLLCIIVLFAKNILTWLYYNEGCHYKIDCATLPGNVDNYDPDDNDTDKWIFGDSRLASAQLTLAVQDIDIDDSDSSGYIDINILISTYTFTSTDSLPLSNSNYNASQS